MATFKKRAIKGHVRKRASADDPLDDAGTEGEALSLDELRDEQRLRKQMRSNAGIGSGALLDAPREEADRRRAEEKSAETSAAGGDGGGAEANNAAGPSLSIADRMTSGTGEVTATTQHEKLMEQYINERMGVGEGADDDGERELTAEEKLYVIPDHLNPKKEQPREAVTDVDADGGLLAYNTGIAEVSLPMDTRLANIERTEGAMRALAAEEMDALNRAARRSNIDVRLLPRGAKELGATERAMKSIGQTRLGQAGVSTGNMNSNYNHHRREWAVQMRARDDAAATRGEQPERRREPSGGAPPGGGGGGPPQQGGGGNDGDVRRVMSSDTRVMERFKKREQNRRR